MNALEEFSKRLKTLRGKTPVKDLAARSQVATTALYKAESGHETVAWKTVEAAYGDLCGTDESYAQLLAMWAATQSRRPVRIETARKSMTKLAENAAATMSQEMNAVRESMERMGTVEQREFALFSQHFAKNRQTREMAALWLRNADGARG